MTASPPPRDLAFAPPPDLSWQPDQRAASTAAMVTYASSIAEEAIAWYLRKKEAKRAGARFTRLGAIIATALAAVIPLLAQIYTVEGKPALQPAWASVALVLAGLAVALDRFFGFSNAWMRFMSSELQIRTELTMFHLDVEARRAAAAEAEVTAEGAVKTLGDCKALLLSVDRIVREETGLWVADLAAAVKVIDEGTQVQGGARGRSEAAR
jgi:hypothetical protein